MRNLGLEYEAVTGVRSVEVHVSSAAVENVVVMAEVHAHSADADLAWIWVLPEVRAQARDRDASDRDLVNDVLNRGLADRKGARNDCGSAWRSCAVLVPLGGVARVARGDAHLEGAVDAASTERSRAAAADSKLTGSVSRSWIVGRKDSADDVSRVHVDSLADKGDGLRDRNTTVWKAVGVR